MHEISPGYEALRRRPLRINVISVIPITSIFFKVTQFTLTIRFLRHAVQIRLCISPSVVYRKRRFQWPLQPYKAGRSTQTKKEEKIYKRSHPPTSFRIFSVGQLGRLIKVKFESKQINQASRGFTLSSVSSPPSISPRNNECEQSTGL